MTWDAMNIGPVQQDNSIYEGNSTRVFTDEVELRLGRKRNSLIGIITASGGIHIALRLQRLWNKSLNISDEALESAEFLADMKSRRQS